VYNLIQAVWPHGHVVRIGAGPDAAYEAASSPKYRGDALKFEDIVLKICRFDKTGPGPSSNQTGDFDAADSKRINHCSSSQPEL
jgi:hypothetical protein